MSIDKKMDDGKPRSGWVSGVNNMLDNAGSYRARCLAFGGALTSSSVDGSDAVYNDPQITLDNHLCNMTFDLSF
jgi:hypothetical protein